MNLLRKRIDLPIVDASGKTVNTTHELDKHTVRVKGILLTADRDEQAYHRGLLGLTVNGQEVLPPEHHAKLLMSGLGVPPGERFLPLDIAPGNGQVKLSYTDNGNLAVGFQTYNVSVYLELEIDEVE